MTTNYDLNQRPDYDDVIQKLADYVLDYEIDSTEAVSTAHLCLIDSIGCALMATQFPQCLKLLGPWTHGVDALAGSDPGPQHAPAVRVPGTKWQLDLTKGAWDIGCLIRWLDFNDTWLAAEWGHPSDNLGAILAIGDYLSQLRVANGKPPVTVADVLDGMIRAHEIQGGLALENSFNRVGLDHVLLVRIASTAVAARMLGGNREQILAAISHAWVDGSSLRTYRHAPNAGSRKSWAAGDASARGVQLALIALKGEMGIPGALTANAWGFQDVSFSHNNRDLSLKPENERQIRFQRPLGSYVMENILFKISFPAEFHAQTACEAAVILHSRIKDRIDQIEKIVITTHESAIRIISKVGPLANPADRDHCLQYMVAVALLNGDLAAEHYEDEYHAAHPEIDRLREKMEIIEDPSYTTDYLDPEKRSIANALQITFADGTSTEKVEVEYPLGHRRRREEGIPVLVQKFCRSVEQCFDSETATQIIEQFVDAGTMKAMPVNEVMSLLSIASSDS